jgi:hypothetical protein
MGQRDDTKNATTPAGPETEPVRFSNGMRLTGREWLGLGIFTAVFVLLGPALWKRAEPFDPGPDYRVPHDLSNDYWLYERFADLAAERYDTVLLGDSVIWGEYVTPRQTLSHYLNEQMGEDRCANLGLDGAHPLALSGLVRHYAGSVRGKSVVLQWNPLWLKSRRADLQDDQATDFNHPRLVPQFVPRIPAYKEEISPRIGVVVEQHVPPGAWVNHLQQAYYDRADIPSWTMAHPYDNPVKPLTRGLPPPDEGLRHLPRPWYKSGIKAQDFPWVDLDSSLQWQAFRDVVETLRRRDNRVFVLVGPFNEHMLTPASRARLQRLKATVTAWLREQGIPHAVPRPLPTDEYGDASHPLAAGYARLARRLLREPFFRHPAAP